MARKGLIVVIAALFTSTAAWGEVKPIRFKNGSLALPQRTAEQVQSDLSSLLAARTSSGSSHVIVQFESPVTDEVRAKLERAGVRLLDYLGDNGFFAVISRSEERRVGKEC